jgi:tRNA 2-selenouridine synthase
LNDEHPLWIEDESRFIGKLRVPDAFFNKMIDAPRIEVVRSLDIRSARILEEYGTFDKELLRERTVSLTKRMGGDRVKASVEGLLNGDMHVWLMPLLDYYDRSYEHFQSRTGGVKLGMITWDEGVPSESIADTLISTYKNTPSRNKKHPYE